MRVISIVIAALFFCSCSKSPVQLYNEGKTAEEQKNFQAALWNYQELVEKHREIALAESAQLRIVFIYSDILRDFDKAAQAYKKLYELFPNSPNASQALFMAGFLYGNEIKNYERAREIYELFLQTYPEHDLAQSARFELETMGKDPLEFIQLQQAEKDAQAKPLAKQITK